MTIVGLIGIAAGGRRRRKTMSMALLRQAEQPWVQPIPMLKGDVMQALSSGNVDCPYFCLVKDSLGTQEKTPGTLFCFKGCPRFPPTQSNCVETVLLAAQTLLYHMCSITIFEIEGRWSAHGNEESSEEACKEEEVVLVPRGGAGHGASSPSHVSDRSPPRTASHE